MGKRVIISGRKFTDALVAAGVVPDNCRRVIIDASYEGLTTVYYEVVADEALLEIDFGNHLRVVSPDVPFEFKYHLEPFDVLVPPPAPPNRDLFGGEETIESKEHTAEYRIRLKEYGENLGKG